MNNQKAEIDIIIVSYAQNAELKKTTMNCIRSLIISEDPNHIKFNIIVIESEKSLAPYQYSNTTTIYPEIPFGYHRYLNIGIKMTSSPYICICNNDLLFSANWATEILKPFQTYIDISSASPFCPILHPEMGFSPNTGSKLGYRIRYEIAGWCLFFKRQILTKIGMLDENIIFWGADNDYSNNLFMAGLKHVLVTSSFVEHLESKTLKKQSTDRKHALTEGEITYYNKKWNVKFGHDWNLLD